jgi:hypothetical protein
LPIRPSGVYWGPWKGLANTYVVGHLGAAALAAVGLSTQRTNFLVAFFSAVGVGSTALVARQVGAREREEAERTAGQSLLLAVVVGLLAVLPCLLWGHALLTTLRQDATQANVALMTPGQQELIHAFLDAGALPDKWATTLCRRPKRRSPAWSGSLSRRRTS